jgi:Rrf2 family protein
MVELARHHGDGPVSLSEMATHEELPRPYLEQLVMCLKEAGLVTSTRGAHGGYELAVPPDRIRMSQVVQALEGPIAPMVCVSDRGHDSASCERTEYCNVNVLWTRVRDAVLVALDSMTLAELAGPRPRHPFHALPVLAAMRPLQASDATEPMIDR